MPFPSVTATSQDGGKMQMCGSADMRMLQWVKCYVDVDKHPHFTHICTLFNCNVRTTNISWNYLLIGCRHLR